MDVRACKACGRLFNYITGPTRCPDCMKKLEEKFQDVKTYIWEHKNASLSEISEATEVPVTQLRQWVREERLSFSDDSPVGLECEVCGKTIKTGRYCDSCKGKLNQALTSAIKPQHASSAKSADDRRNRMRYLK